jgi:hypothetical protein
MKMKKRTATKAAEEYIPTPSSVVSAATGTSVPKEKSDDLFHRVPFHLNFLE